MPRRKAAVMTSKAKPGITCGDCPPGHAHRAVFRAAWLDFQGVRHRAYACPGCYLHRLSTVLGVNDD